MKFSSKIRLPHEVDMTAGLRALVAIANELGSINKRMTKYLDRVENAMTAKIEIDMPTFDYKKLLRRRSDIEIIGDGPPEMYCSWCMGEIYSQCFARCDHAILCMACAPCDECSTEEE
jgi:hypothetical protein